jgi:hypothetical protein
MSLNTWVRLLWVIAGVIWAGVFAIIHALAESLDNLVR